MQGTNIDLILDELENSNSNTTHFSENWSQGRSAYGGLAAAFAVTAMRNQIALAQTSRSIMVAFISPVVAGGVSVEAATMRQGTRGF